MIQQFFNKNKYILLLLIIAVLSHWQWFSWNSVLFSWDFWRWEDEVVKDFWPFGLGAYFNYFSFGEPNITVFFNGFFWLWGAVGSYVLGSKITLLIPTAILSFLSPYFLTKYLVKDKRIAFVSALFFGFSSSLMYLELSHLPIAFGFAIMPLVLLLFIKLLNKFNYKNLLIFALIYSVGIWYEVRIMYLATWIIFIYWLTFDGWKNFWQNKVKYTILSSLILLLNLFWLLPSIFGSSEAISQTANRGTTDSVSNTIFYSFANFKYKWSGGEVVQADTLHNIPWFFWLAPIFALSIFVIFRKIENTQDKKWIIFFGAVALAGILFSKQADPPFTELYAWLYENFPGFNLFRVGSKFLSIVALGYLGLFAFSLKYYLKIFSQRRKDLKFKNIKLTRIFASLLLIGFSLLFIKQGQPLFTGEVGNLFVARVEPTEYIELNKFLKNQDGFFRTVWLPNASQWGYYNANKPRISASRLEKREWKNASNLFYNERKEKIDIINILNSIVGKKLADISAVRFFIVPMPDKQDELLYHKKSEYLATADKIKKINFLTEVSLPNISKIKIYENKSYQPYIFGVKRLPNFKNDKDIEKIDLSFENVSPSKKRVVLKNIPDNFYLIMSEQYNENWRVFLTENNVSVWQKWLPFAKPKEVLRDDHFKLAGFLNAWQIKQNSFSETAERDIELTIEYWPERWYYFGAFISGLTLSFCISWLGILFYRKFYE